MATQMMPAHRIRKMEEKKLSERVRFEMEVVFYTVSHELEGDHLISYYEKNKEAINIFLKEAIESEARLTSMMDGKIDKTTTMAEIEKEMRSSLGSSRVDSIQKSFAIETYRIKIVKDIAQVHRGGIVIEPDITLSTIESIEKAIELQRASLLLELFLFLLSCVNISVDISKADIKKIVQLLQTNFTLVSAFQTAFNKCVEAWNEEGCGVWGKAKAIFYLMKDSYLLGIFWKIIKLFFEDTSTLEKIKEIVKVVLMIISAFVTDWSALLTKLALAVDSVGYLAEKIENLVKFSDRKKALQKTKKY